MANKREKRTKVLDGERRRKSKKKRNVWRDCRFFGVAKQLAKEGRIYVYTYKRERERIERDDRR